MHMRSCMYCTTSECSWSHLLFFFQQSGWCAGERMRDGGVPSVLFQFSTYKRSLISLVLKSELCRFLQWWRDILLRYLRLEYGQLYVVVYHTDHKETHLDYLFVVPSDMGQPRSPLLLVLSLCFWFLLSSPLQKKS